MGIETMFGIINDEAIRNADLTARCVKAEDEARTARKAAVRLADAADRRLRSMGELSRQCDRLAERAREAEAIADRLQAMNDNQAVTIADLQRQVAELGGIRAGIRSINVQLADGRVMMINADGSVAIAG